MKLSKSPSLLVPNSIRAGVLLALGSIAACNSNASTTPDVIDPNQIIQASVETLNTSRSARETNIRRLEEEIHTRQTELDRLREAQRTTTAAICRLDPNQPACPR